MIIGARPTPETSGDPTSNVRPSVKPHPVVFLDLDNTLFASARRQPEEGVKPAATYRDGRPSAWMNEAQASFFDWLNATTTLIPCTGRSLDATQRVLLPFHSWTICCFGGLVLTPDGQVSAAWERAQRALFGEETLGEISQTLSRLEGETRDWIETQGLKIRLSRVEAGVSGGYLCVKHQEIKASQPAEVALSPISARWREALSTLDQMTQGSLQAREVLTSGETHTSSQLALPIPSWTLHINGNNVTLMPPSLSKARAVRWLIEHTFSGRLTLGAGDSLSDLSFMRRCDFSIIPASSQVSDTLASSAHEHHSERPPSLASPSLTPSVRSARL